MKDERIEELIERYLADQLSDDEKAEFVNWLDNEPSHQEIFRQSMELEYALTDQMTLPEEKKRGSKIINYPSIRLKWSHLSVAALFFLCIGLTWFLLDQSKNPSKLDPKSISVAVLEHVGADAVFSTSQKLTKLDEMYLGKGWIELEQGVLEILFHSGAMVQLTGPTRFGINTEMRGFLDFGQITVYAPKSARDFVVETESMEVVDKGTRFKVTVDQQSRESSVSVIEGLVDLHLGSKGTDRIIRPLDKGYVAHVDVFGEIVEITKGPATYVMNEISSPTILANWKFDKVSNRGEIEDSSEADLHGTISSGRSPKLVPGIHGQALEFSGNEFINLKENLTMLCQLSDFTLTAWVRDPTGPLAMVFSLSGDSERHRVQLYLAKGFVRFGWQDGAHFDSISGRIDGWQSSRWYHIAVTYEDNLVRLYRDGKIIASGSVGANIGTPVCTPAMIKNPSHAYIGWLDDGRQGNDSAPQYFKGQMDEVQLYSGALSKQGVQFVYEHPGMVWMPENN